MSRAPVACWRLLRVLLHGLHGLAIVLARFPSLPAARRHALVGWWSAKLLRLMGLSLHASGTPHAGAKLVVANHVSWLDIAALHAVLPEARFVSKSDVKHWPLVGRLVAGAGTLFIERESKRDALRVVHQSADALRAGDTVAVFPEGTTGEGPVLLPFHANLLQAAIVTGTPVQPVVLRFADARHAFSPAVEFVGDTTLAQSLWRILCARGLEAHVTVLTAEGSRHADRRALAEHLRGVIGEALARAASAA